MQSWGPRVLARLQSHVVTVERAHVDQRGAPDWGESSSRVSVLLVVWCPCCLHLCRGLLPLFYRWNIFNSYQDHTWLVGKMRQYIGFGSIVYYDSYYRCPPVIVDTCYGKDVSYLQFYEARCLSPLNCVLIRNKGQP